MLDDGFGGAGAVAWHAHDPAVVRSCEGNFRLTVDRLAGSTFKAHALRGEQIAFLLDQGMTLAEIRAGVISLADTLAAEV